MPNTIYTFDDGVNPFIGNRASKFHIDATSAYSGAYGIQGDQGSNFVNAYLPEVVPRQTKLGAWIRPEGTSVSGIGLTLCGDLANPASGYNCFVDFRTPEIEIRTAFSAPQAISSPIPSMVADTWYWLEFEGLDANDLQGRLYDAPNGTLLASVTLTDSSLTSGYVGVPIYTVGSIDQITIFDNTVVGTIYDEISTSVISSVVILNEDIEFQTSILLNSTSNVISNPSMIYAMELEYSSLTDMTMDETFEGVLPLTLNATFSLEMTLPFIIGDYENNIYGQWKPPLTVQGDWTICELQGSWT